MPIKIVNGKSLSGCSKSSAICVIASIPKKHQRIKVAANAISLILNRVSGNCNE